MKCSSWIGYLRLPAPRAGLAGAGEVEGLQEVVPSILSPCLGPVLGVHIGELLAELEVPGGGQHQPAPPGRPHQAGVAGVVTGGRTHLASK